MGNGAKASMVVVGLFALCGIPVLGPVLSDTGSMAVELLLGYDQEKAVENRKNRVMADYKEGGELGKAKACCVGCGVDWDHFNDRCAIRNQTDIDCYVKCGE